MGTFKPRLDATGMYQSKYYYGDNIFDQSGYGLPNCTCYAWGRLYEISGVRPHASLVGDGGQFYPNAVAGGYYEVGATPKLGAIICYGSSSGGSGHVGVVEQINVDGSFVISQSGYYRPVADYPPDTTNYFWTNVCSGDSKMAGWMIGRYVFQGFIYNPEEPVEPDNPGGESPTSRRSKRSSTFNNKFAVLFARNINRRF